jgi:hypothetical protein
MIWAILMGATPLDPVGAPLDFYLTDPKIGAVLQGVVPGLQSCVGGKDFSVGVGLALLSTGGIKVRQIGPVSAANRACLDTLFSAAESPSHHGEDLEVETTVYLRDGVVLVSPSPRVFRRLVGPLMLFVSGDADARLRVAEYLGGGDARER